MKRAYLEQDMVSEQKNLLGFMSYRQAIYCFIGGLMLYTFVPYVFKFSKFLFGWIPALVCSLIFVIPIVFLVVFLAFTKNKKSGYFRDKDYLMRFTHKHEIGHWRRGTNNNLKPIQDEELNE